MDFGVSNEGPLPEGEGTIGIIPSPSGRGLGRGPFLSHPQ
jgi:hypothetical protein